MAKFRPVIDAQRIEPVIGEVPAPAPRAAYTRESSGPGGGRVWIVVVLILLLGGAGAYWYFGREAPPPAPVAVAPAPAAPVKTEPEIRHPIAPAATESPLPPLATSDVVVFDALATLLNKNALGGFINMPDIIKRVVVAVDNLPRENLAQRLSPVKPVPGQFAVTKGGGQQFIAAANAARYSPYVKALEGIDAEKLVAVYVRFYPLFQQAYRDLGYPKGYFNDRLVETLDVMIAAPEPAGQVALVQEKVMYEFAEAKLEALPVGQKMMLRMGTENARKVKAKLREVRALVASGKPQ